MGLPADLLTRPDASDQPLDRPPPDERRPAAKRWIPIRSLAERHRPRILAHLLALPEHDRYLRFGYVASDAQIAGYVDRINFSQDEVFGVFNRRLTLIALAHLAGMPGVREAEFGVSVLPAARGRGFGGRLFEHAMLHARNRDVEFLVIHALAENTPMLRIARGAGASVEREGGEAQARLRLPPDNLQSHVDALIGDGAAEIDYRLKAQAQRLNAVIEGFDGLKQRLSGEAQRDADD